MRSVILRGAFAVALLVLPTRAADYSLVAVGSTTISPEGTITVEVFVNGVLNPDRLRGYQATIEIVPGVGTTGSLGLLDPVTPDPNNDSIFVDKTRTDWVFFFVAGTVFAPTNPGKLQLGATMFDPSGAVQVTSPAYCGTYVLTPSGDALGDFQISFQLVDPDNPGAKPTFLLRPDGNLVAFTDTGLTVTVAPPSPEPDNDDCVNREVIAGGVTPFTTENATMGGPALPVSCDEGAGLSFEQDVWYEHVASCSGVLTITTCNDADFDTRLAVYGTGSSICTCPLDNTDLIACNDNAAGCGVGTSEVSLGVSAGECVTLRVGGLGAAEGTGNLTLTCAADLCADAEPLAVGSTVSGSTRNTAINDGIGPDCGTGPVDSPGVWYVVTGTGNLMTASLPAGATFDTRLTVYQGACVGLSCVADADNPGGSLESAAWCSTSGTPYLILVHGSGGATGSFTLNVSEGNCSDGDGCTDDSCSGGACVHIINYDPVTDCCTPGSGSLATIDDSNPCTVDSCNSSNGVVSHAPVPDAPNEACDDRDPCTLDACQSGVCFSTDINTLSCSNDADCDGFSTCGASGLCECATTTLELFADAGGSFVEGCYTTGAFFTVRVEIGPPDAEVVSATPIIGAQIFLEYDAATVGFVKIEPGRAADPASPFTLPLLEFVDPALGTIDYQVAASLGGAGATTPTIIALITFEALAECNTFVRFRPFGPNGSVNLLSTVGGGRIDPALVDLSPVKVDQNPPLLAACPSDIFVPPDSGVFTSTVSWVTPTATDSCDVGPVAVSCDPPSGTLFEAGAAPVTCVATDSCGLQDQCTFNVTVEAPVVTVDIELSAALAPGPLLRCITFDLWDCDGPPAAHHVTVRQPIVFTSGSAAGITVEVPGGQWECMTARDELHTLRSQAIDFGTLDGTAYTASFMGSRTSGGHWLLGGNLNDDDFIDILDFGVFFAKFLTVADPDSPCGKPAPDANINGDNVVDTLDLVFLAGPNALKASEPVCCGGGGGVAGASSGPVISITIEELRARGLGYMVEADRNGDGVLDQKDIIALLSGESPPDHDPSVLRDPKTIKRHRSPRH